MTNLRIIIGLSIRPQDTDKFKFCWLEANYNNWKRLLFYLTRWYNPCTATFYKWLEIFSNWENILMFCSFRFSFLVFSYFWQRSNENTKILHNLCLHFSRQDGQDRKKTERKSHNYIDQNTKNQKTKPWDEQNVNAFTKKISKWYGKSEWVNSTTFAIYITDFPIKIKQQWNESI